MGPNYVEYKREESVTMAPFEAVLPMVLKEHPGMGLVQLVPGLYFWGSYIGGPVVEVFGGPFLPTAIVKRYLTIEQG